jgi:hypothetical protein
MVLLPLVSAFWVPLTAIEVNHIPTLTGGIGYDDLARFYKVCTV